MKKKNLSPTQTVFISFIILIVVGTLLLKLPIATKKGVESLSLIDSAFTAVSAVCVTGLVIEPTIYQWSFFGQLVIILLIQIGGLSLIAILSIWSKVVKKKLDIARTSLLQEVFNLKTLGESIKLFNFAIKYTFIVEGVGAFTLFLYFYIFKNVAFLKALSYGVFHSISAFCNAGFDIFSNNSMIDFKSDIVINVVSIALIVLGGIGFPVAKEVYEYFINKDRVRLKTHSKLALWTTLVLILFGSIFILILEYSNTETLGSLVLWEKIIVSTFQSVSLRTAGFFSINLSHLRESTKFFSSLLMMIGGSPAGVSGGIKTVTVAVVFASVFSAIKGKEGVQVMGRFLSVKTLQKALAIMLIMFSLLLTSSMLLKITENQLFGFSFLDIFFECASALSTYGASTGLTPYLSYVGKIIIMICMFIGRTGPITVIYALTEKSSKKANIKIKYPETDVILG